MIAIETIDREAKAAAEQGDTPERACRWPLNLPEGERWLDTYNATIAALEVESC